MKGTRKRRANQTASRKLRTMLIVIVAASIVIIVALFIGNVWNQLSSNPASPGGML